jgi:hypothetical protein
LTAPWVVTRFEGRHSVRESNVQATSAIPSGEPDGEFNLDTVLKVIPVVPFRHKTGSPAHSLAAGKSKSNDL